MPDTLSPSSPEAVSRSPATGAVIERFPCQTAAEVGQLLGDAQAAFHAWRDWPMARRAAVYTALEKELLARKDAIAAAITAEMGKIRTEAVAEVEKCAAMAAWFAAHGPGLLADAPVEVPEGGRAAARPVLDPEHRFRRHQGRAGRPAHGRRDAHGQHARRPRWRRRQAG